jgi:hypothetical protein
MCGGEQERRQGERQGNPNTICQTSLNGSPEEGLLRKPGENGNDRQLQNRPPSEDGPDEGLQQMPVMMSTGTVFDGELSKVLDGRGYGRFREAA